MGGKRQLGSRKSQLVETFIIRLERSRKTYATNAGGLKSANAACRDAPLKRSRANRGGMSELATLDVLGFVYGESEI